MFFFLRLSYAEFFLTLATHKLTCSAHLIDALSKGEC